MRSFWLFSFILSTSITMIFYNGSANAQSGNAMQATQVRQGERIDQLENEIRRLTGQNEALIHKIDKISKTLKSVTDQLTSATKKEDQKSDNVQEAIGFDLDPQEKPRKTILSAGENQVESATPVINKSDSGRLAIQTKKSDSYSEVRQEVPPEKLYKQAQDLILKSQKFSQAQAILNKFIQKYKTHPLTPNAYYWLGRTHFVMNDFQNAAFAFAEGFKKFRKSEKAPANLLNLGMALASLGSKKEACEAWTQLTKSYPKAPASVKRRVGREQRREKCT